jgi:hypothetical protein
MDSLVKQLARELTDAISAAVAADPRVEACREKARAAGFDIRLSMEAVVGFHDADPQKSLARKALPQPFDMSATDRRFLKSLRISADEAVEKKEL